MTKLFWHILAEKVVTVTERPKIRHFGKIRKIGRASEKASVIFRLYFCEDIKVRKFTISHMKGPKHKKWRLKRFLRHHHKGVKIFYQP